MQLTHQAQGNWQGVQTTQSILQGDDVIAHLSKVGWTSLNHGAGLGGQQLTQTCLCALYSDGKHGFLAKERSNQQMRLGQMSSFTCESA